MHRFFLTPEDQIIGKSIKIFNNELVHQFSRVLRFNKNEKIILINDNKEYISEIQEINKKYFELNILDIKESEGEPSIYINLFFCLTKKLEKIELILEKGTEIGISEFTPLISERTERKVLGKIPRLNRIIKEAAEQSCRTRIPQLNEIISLKKIFEKTGIQQNEKELNLIPHPKADLCISNIEELPKKINIFIGPEGGFSENEINKFSLLNNSKLVNLGQRVLKTETASIILPAILLLK